MFWVWDTVQFFLVIFLERNEKVPEEQIWIRQRGNQTIRNQDSEDTTSWFVNRSTIRCLKVLLI
jgi:hypothetical protein